MARPIAVEAPPRDMRDERAAQLKDAPLDHAAALLDAYELLDELHKSGVLEMLRGALGARDKLTDLAASAVDTPQSVNALRNAILLGKVLGAIDPQVMESVAFAARETLGPQINASHEPPGLFALLKRFRRRETRRSIALMQRFLEAMGGRLGQKRSAETKS